MKPYMTKCKQKIIMQKMQLDMLMFFLHYLYKKQELILMFGLRVDLSTINQSSNQS